MKMMIFKIYSCLMSTSYYSDSFSTLQPNISFFIDIDSLSYYSFLNFKEITQFPSGPITFIELNWIERFKEIKENCGLAKIREWEFNNQWQWINPRLWYHLLPSIQGTSFCFNFHLSKVPIYILIICYYFFPLFFPIWAIGTVQQY